MAHPEFAIERPRRRRASDQQRREAEANRGKVVAATRQLFAETGSLASMNEIASRAGVGKGTVYRAFPDRSALLATVAVYQLDEVRAEAERALSQSGDAAPIFVEFLRFMIDYNLSNGLYLELFRHSVPTRVLEAQAVVKQQIETLYERSIESGAVESPVSSQELHFVFNAFIQYLNISSLDSAPDLKRIESLILRSIGFKGF